MALKLFWFKKTPTNPKPKPEFYKVAYKPFREAGGATRLTQMIRADSYWTGDAWVHFNKDQREVALVARDEVLSIIEGRMDE